jgi:hypothetical protein
MKIPSWAPPELVEAYKDLKAKVESKPNRPIPKYNPREALVAGRLYVGDYFYGEARQLEVVSALIAAAPMQKVWTALERRKDSFKPVDVFPFGKKTQAHNLLGSCLLSEYHWVNVPMRTRAESKRFYEKIAGHADALIDLLLQSDFRSHLLSMRAYVSPSRIREFSDALVDDDHPVWSGFDGYLDNLIFEALLEPLPAYLLTLVHRARDFASQPALVKQPKSKAAQANFYVERLSDYFNRAYGTPLHAHVATIVSSIFGMEMDENRVRAFLRTRKKKPKRKKKAFG